MAQTVQLKRSATPGKAPTVSDLQLGELAINTYDGKLYIKKNNGTDSIVSIAQLETDTLATITARGATTSTATSFTSNLIVGSAAINTTATSGFLWITSCAGIPTGAPTAPYTNAAALVVDTTNNNLVYRSGNNWVSGTKLTGTNSEYGWNDITAEINVRGTGSNDPTWAVYRNGIYAFSFSAILMNQCWASFHIKHDYAPGTPFHLHVHWSTTGTNTGVCRWGFEYTFAKGHQQSTFAAPNTVYVEQAATGTAYTHMIAETTAISSSEIEPDCLILVRLFRDANNVTDTLTDTAIVFTADIHYQCDRLSTKNKSPNFYA